MARDTRKRTPAITSERPDAIRLRRRSRPSPRRMPFAALGIIASHAPPAALLAALHALRPQCEVRFKKLKAGSARLGPHYLVEVRLDGTGRERPQIDLWLRIKSALMAAFPAGGTNAVTPLDT